MHSPTAAAGYFLLPSRTVLLVPDQAPAGKSARRPAPDALLRPGAPRCVAAPRAPPLV
jgi:hypothetical protein